MAVKVDKDRDPLVDLKKVSAIALRKDAAGDVWFLGVAKQGGDYVAVAYRGVEKATRFELPADDRFVHPEQPFASAGGVAYLGVGGATLQIEGDAVTVRPAPGGTSPRALGATGGRAYAVLTKSEGESRTAIHALEKGKWKKLATPALDHVRSVTPFGDGLVVIENNQETSHVLGLDGKKRGSFETYRTTMEIILGEARFVTLCDSFAELRDASGKEVGKLAGGDAGGDFLCGAHAGSDAFVFFTKDRHDKKKRGAIVRWDPAGKAKKPVVDPRSKALPDDASPSEMEIDRAGKIWLNCGSWDGKTRLLVLDANGSLTTIKK
jgi:hypothetical protein